MTVLQPPHFMQNLSTHTAQLDRLALGGLLQSFGSNNFGAIGGVRWGNGLDLQVTQSGPSMNVAVAAGQVYIPGIENAVQGVYSCVSDASATKAIAAAHPTLARKDAVVAQVFDAFYSGATNAWDIVVLTGVAGSGSLPSLTGLNVILLAEVNVGAGVTSITNANIVDRRVFAQAAGAPIITTNIARPNNPYTGQQVYETDKKRFSVRDGTVWLPSGGTQAYCELVKSAPQSAPASTETAVTFSGGANTDTDAFFNLGTSQTRVFAPWTGTYEISGTACIQAFTTTVASRFTFSWFINGSVQNFTCIDYPTGLTVFPCFPLPTTFCELTAGQFMEMSINHTSGASRTINATQTRLNFKYLGSIQSDIG